MDGKTMVFDPSMFKGPVTPEEWRSKMVNKTPDKGTPIIKNTDSKPFFIDPHGDKSEDPDYSKTKNRFEKHKKNRDAMIEAEKAQKEKAKKDAKATEPSKENRK
jgi:hypothetical protein